MAIFDERQFKHGYSLDDILLVPKYSRLSRKDVVLSSKLFDDLVLQLPIISSPMSTVTEDQMAVAMQEAGALGIVHRYNTIEEQVQICNKIRAKDKEPVAAIGMRGDYLKRVERLYCEAGVRYFCIDVAHGHHAYMAEALKQVKKYAHDIRVIAGNIATPEGFQFLVDCGADAVRASIGGGSICSTRIQTGHGVPNATTIIECADLANRWKIPLILDGGIKNAGDIVKALALGAHFVMCGSLVSGTEETPGELVRTPKGVFKPYSGMASRQAQKEWKDSYSSDEGVSTLVPARGSVKDVLGELENNIRSGFSYSGARNIKELRHNQDYIIVQTSLGYGESHTHIYNKVSK